MQLAIQVAAALAAGGLVLLAMRYAGLKGKRAVGAIALIPMVASCLLALPVYREQLSELLDSHKENARLTARDVRLGNGIGINADVDFLAWAKRRLGDEETFGFAIENTQEAGSVQQWALFQLAPHVAVEPPSAANWIVFYDVNPEDYARLAGLSVYKPGFAIARSRLAR
jgi:hypothetical protein